MKTHCSTIPALVIVFCLLVPANSVSERPKPGHCPKYFESFAPLKPCNRDRDCPGAHKCCVFDYGSRCAPPISIMPACPEPGRCVEECSSEVDCPFGQRCCYNGCGHECTGPRPGICGHVPSSYVCHDLCADDYDCPEMKKCCFHRCGRYCKEPVFLEAAS